MACPHAAGTAAIFASVSARHAGYSDVASPNFMTGNTNVVTVARAGEQSRPGAKLCLLELHFGRGLRLRVGNYW